MPPNIIISPFLPHNSSRLQPSIYLKNDKKYQAWISLAIICRVLQLLHLHVHISSFFPPPHTHTPAPLLISFIQGFQRTNICNDSAESQGGATRGASRRLPAREGMGGMGGTEEGRGGWGGGGWRGVEGGRQGEEPRGQRLCIFHSWTPPPSIPSFSFTPRKKRGNLSRSRFLV